VADNSLVVAGAENGDVYAFERGTGETRWEANITRSVAALETTGSHVWVGDTDIGLTAYERETGSLVHRSTRSVNGDDIAVADDVLLLGGDTATAYTID
jgi:outer membrane protein assembly factor BamB